MPALLNTMSILKAKSEVVQGLRNAGLQRDALSALTTTTSPITPVTLPGFGACASNSGKRVIDWLVPSISKDLDEVVAVYEDFASRKNGKVQRPNEVFRQLVQKGKWGELFPLTGAPRWWSSAVLMVLMTHKTHGGTLTTGEDFARLELGDYLFDVRYDQFWSNFDNKYRKPTRTPTDYSPHCLQIDPLETTDPLAALLVSSSVGLSAQWALNALMQAGEELTADDVFVRQKPRGRKPVKVTPKYSHDRARAIDDIREMIAVPGRVAVCDLYEVAVPTVMSCLEFKKAAGNPWREPWRLLGPKPCRRINDLLSDKEFAMK